MFERSAEAAGAVVTIEVDGKPVVAWEGDSVAAALLADGQFDCRSTAVSQSARGPYCLMGVCFDCLVCIDGAPNRQACMVPVRAGMKVQRQRGKREVEA